MASWIGGSKFCFHFWELLPQRGKCRWTGGCRRWVEVWKQSREKKVGENNFVFSYPHKVRKLIFSVRLLFHQLLRMKKLFLNNEVWIFLRIFVSEEVYHCELQGCNNIRSRWILSQSWNKYKFLSNRIKCYSKVFVIHIVRSQVAFFDICSNKSRRVIYITFLELQNISKSNSCFRSVID